MPPGAVSVARNLAGAVKTAPYKPFYNNSAAL